MGQNAKREMSLIEAARRRRLAGDLHAVFLQNLSGWDFIVRAGGAPVFAITPEEQEFLVDLLRAAAEAPLAP